MNRASIRGNKQLVGLRIAHQPRNSKLESVSTKLHETESRTALKAGQH